MIKAEHLVKRYGGNTALDDVSFEIGEGEIVGLLGPNGAGKSTTMNILTGYLAPTSGTASVDGIDIQDDPFAAKKKIGYLPEQPPLYPDMTVDEYLGFVYELKGCTFPKKEHLDEICDAVRLSEVRPRLIRNLSKGYRQRVGIAEALVGNPPVLIFDEPTVGLDPKQIIEVRNLLRHLSKSHTVILSTHILSEVQAVCERILIIDRGVLVADARTDDLTRTIEGHNRFRARISAPQRSAVLSALRKVGGIRNVVAGDTREGDAYVYTIESEPGVDIRKSVFYLCAREDWPLLGFEKAEMDLEEIFLRLVDGQVSPEKKAKR